MRVIQFYRKMSPSHEALWNLTRMGRDFYERQGDPNRWDLDSLVAFLYEAYGFRDRPLAPGDRLPDNLVPPMFDPQSGDNMSRRRAAGLNPRHG